MKAIRFDRFGPPEVLALVDTDEPHPRVGQVRIQVRAAGVNGRTNGGDPARPGTRT
jgi:NADPH:quinone reductase-like Zn-dependent oxidoreductase